MSSLYDRDFYSWALDQAAALRAAGRLRPNLPRELDWENLAEEIEALARADARELTSRYEVLLSHLLKWEFQPEARSRSWLGTLAEQRNRLVDLLDDSPGLKPLRQERFERAYRRAIDNAVRETGLPESAFPTSCPYTIEQAMDRHFLPEPAKAVTPDQA